MSLLEKSPEIADTDLRILATDIDPNVVAFANQGSYPERLVGGIPPKMLAKYFVKNEDNTESIFQARDALKKMVSFRELNLLSNWPMQQKIDLIFCRNVVIYFDLETQNKLWPRFYGALSPDGYLFLGHSERIADPESAGFFTYGPTTYRPNSSHSGSTSQTKGK